MLYDQFCVEIQNFFGQRFAQPRNGNLNLVQNIVEQMAGDENLIAVRSRATLNRPFEKIDAMQAQAEEAFRSKRKELEDSLRETQQRLSELQAAKKDKGQQSLMLSSEQQQEIKKFREKEAQAKIELRQVKKQLKRKTESLENELKWVNIAGMPFLVTAFGLGLAFLKGQRAKKQ
jgi:gliding motility-associatede transport system auxiliary component